MEGYKFVDAPKINKLELRIDKANFDEEVIRLASDFYEAFSKEVDALDIRDKNKSNLEIKSKEADIKIRKKTKEELKEEFGITSLSESAIKALVETSASVKEANSVYLESKRIAGKWTALREALDRKYKMIRIYSYEESKRRGMKDYIEGKEANSGSVITSGMRRKLEMYGD